MVPNGAGVRKRGINPAEQLGLGNTSTSGCEADDFMGFPTGNIALLQRGTCTFELKAEARSPLSPSSWYFRLHLPNDPAFKAATTSLSGSSAP